LTDRVPQAPNFLSVGWGYQQAAKDHNVPLKENKPNKPIKLENST